jgi:hypothetical protein
MPTARKVPGRPFKPGQSGNPGGRMALAARIDHELGSKDGRKLIEAYVTIAFGDHAATARMFPRAPRWRAADIIAALQWLSDRRFGKAPQSTEDADGHALMPVVIENHYHGIVESSKAS